VRERRHDCGKAAVIPHTTTDGLREHPSDHVGMPLEPGTAERRILVAGGGVAALEACLALRHHMSAADLAITLMAPTQRFDYLPLSVLEAFDGISRWSLTLATFAADQDLELVHDALVAVAPQARTAATGAGRDLSYDALLVATGGHGADAVHGALTFRGPREGHALRALLDGQPSSIVFAGPPGATWPLPLYELALLSAADLRRAGAATKVTLVTPEPAPLSLFGAGASELVADLLARHEVEIITSAGAVAVREGLLELDDGSSVDAAHVVALPRIVGRRFEGIPRDHEDFVPIDDHCRVVGLDHVYAAGDVANFPVKHGGLAAQQADAAAEAILAQLGLPIVARSFDPVIQGVLFSDRDPAYLRAPLGEGAAQPSDPRAYSLWWPPSKIAGRHLSPYLAIRAGLPRTPEVRPEGDTIAIAVDARDIVRSVRGVIGGDRVPPG
jgi:sulfide:quinone oxidoreductase